MSDDGRLAIVVIALLGNPFSPWYARARRRGIASADPLAFSSMNVALYARGASAWTLLERTVLPGARSASGMQIGRSTIQWVGDRLEIDIDERTTPLRFPLRGRVTLRPEILTETEITLDPLEEHRWWPVAPLARIEVDFAKPGVRFSGHGYHDANAGSVPLEATFARWSWSRARAHGRAYVTYDVRTPAGERSLAVAIGGDGRLEPMPGSSTWSTSLGHTRWQIERRARVDVWQKASLVRSLEDGPFYARALVDTTLGGKPVLAMHETLDAERLKRRWVRHFTRYRM